MFCLIGYMFSTVFDPLLFLIIINTLTYYQTLINQSVNVICHNTVVYVDRFLKDEFWGLLLCIYYYYELSQCATIK